MSSTLTNIVNYVANMVGAMLPAWAVKTTPMVPIVETEADQQTAYVWPAEWRVDTVGRAAALQGATIAIVLVASGESSADTVWQAAESLMDELLFAEANNGAQCTAVASIAPAEMEALLRHNRIVATIRLTYQWH